MKNLFLFLLVFITACTHLQPSPYLAEKPFISKPLKAWTARGSIAIHTSQQNTQARFVWQQQGRNYTIDFFGPLGSYHQRLCGSPQGVELLDQHNHLHTAKTPEKLLKQTTGWELPVSQLYFWIQGLSKPHTAWDVKYERTIIVGNNSLPQIISITSLSKNIKIKIKIDNWAFT